MFEISLLTQLFSKFFNESIQYLTDRKIYIGKIKAYIFLINWFQFLKSILLLNVFINTNV